MDSTELSDRLAKLSTTLSPAERENLKLLLSMAAGGFLGGHAPQGSEDMRRTALQATQRALPKLHDQEGRPQFPTGVVFCGRAPVLSAEDIALMNRESLENRHRAERFDDHYVLSGLPGARGLAVSQPLLDFITDQVGPVRATDRANYLWYDEPGLGIDPHVDKNEFSLNILTMLEHLPEQRSSELILYPPDSDELHIQLRPGESLIFFADRVAHQRTRTVPGESIRLVSFGYHTV